MSLRSVCLLRLSALGDVTHVLPVIHALRSRWPGLELTWIIGRVEARLIGSLPGVRLLAVDKSKLAAAWRSVRRELAGERFDALLLMQVSLRAGLLSTAVKARRRIGYPRTRSKELHGCFVNEHLPERQGGHVLDQLLDFARQLDAPVVAPEWPLPIAAAAHDFAAQLLPGATPTLLVSPCSSHRRRNWNAAGYARVAEHAATRGFRVALIGGRSQLEQQMAQAIKAESKVPLLDLVGRDTLQQLPALLQRAALVLTPDSGPSHIANAVGTPVLALHAATDARRSGPYSCLELAVDAYDRAARRFRGKPGAALPWGSKIEEDGVMDLIEPAEVIAGFERWLAGTRPA